MHRAFVTLCCSLSLAGGSALAQQQPQQQGSGASLTDKAKQVAQDIGEKTREAAEAVKEKVQATGDKAKTDPSSEGGQASAKGSERMQKQADAEFKSAKAKCDAIRQDAQKTLCEKQAAAAHANAEVRIAKANVEGQSGSTSSMGAGKSRH